MKIKKLRKTGTHTKMDKNRATRILAIAKLIGELQVEFKDLTGATFNVSQNFIDTVHFVQGYLAAVAAHEPKPVITPQVVDTEVV
jgi:hypothetical protein